MLSSKPVERTAILVAASDEARAALGGKKEVRIKQFPFKVGRESRSNPLARIKTEVERRLGGAPQLNDLYLIEPASTRLLHISREHFLIDRIGDRFVLVDRESACGTIVAGFVVGGGGSTEPPTSTMAIPSWSAGTTRRSCSSSSRSATDISRRCAF